MRSVSVKVRDRLSRYFLRLTVIQAFWVAIFLFYSIQASAQHADAQASLPDQFALGVYGSGDAGPPFDHYWLYVVRSAPEGAVVEQIALTPQGQRCTQPATIERAAKIVNMPVAALLDNRNPCELTEEDLHRKSPPCTAPCRVSMGSASYVMRVKCGSELKRIPLNYQEPDIFSPYVSAPRRPLSINDLQLRLSSPSSSMKPVLLPIPDSGKQQPGSADAGLQTVLDIKAGKYDDFGDGGFRPSEMMRRIERSIEGSRAKVELESIWPDQPEHLTLPIFPPNARPDSTDSVSVHLKLDAEGKVIQQTFFSGASVFQDAVRRAAAGWQFQKGAAGREISASIAFGACPAR